MQAAPWRGSWARRETFRHQGSSSYPVFFKQPLQRLGGIVCAKWSPNRIGRAVLKNVHSCLLREFQRQQTEYLEFFVAWQAAKGRHQLGEGHIYSPKHAKIGLL